MIISDALLGLSLTKVLLHLLNFAILFTCLWLILYKPVKKAVQERQDRIAKQRQEAEENLNAAKSAREESERRLGAIDEEIAEKRRASDAAATAAYEETVGRAEERAAVIIHDAEVRAEQETQRAIEEAKDEIKDVAVSLAENIIGSHIDEVDDEMIETAIKDWKNG
ncbi:MAG: ATP synthase F0 subunit B [Clostridia bacterium]|nr:ATP synthase F0 subunit B [Clostridia bacterium]